jgi:hypothetical protein
VGRGGVVQVQEQGRSQGRERDQAGEQHHSGPVGPVGHIARGGGAGE